MASITMSNQGQKSMTYCLLASMRSIHFVFFVKLISQCWYTKGNGLIEILISRNMKFSIHSHRKYILIVLDETPENPVQKRKEKQNSLSFRRVLIAAIIDKHI